MKTHVVVSNFICKNYFIVPYFGLNVLYSFDSDWFHLFASNFLCFYGSIFIKWSEGASLYTVLGKGLTSLFDDVQLTLAYNG